MTFSCDGRGGLVPGSLTQVTNGSVCVNGVFSSAVPASTCPNNRCYRTNAAYEAGQAWACQGSATATMTAAPSASPSPAAPSTPLPVSTDGSCGAQSGHRCPASLCCSQYGWCGSVTTYCGVGCQSAYGVCQSGATSGAVSNPAEADAQAAAAAATWAKPSTSAGSSPSSSGNATTVGAIAGGVGAFAVVVVVLAFVVMRRRPGPSKRATPHHLHKQAEGQFVADSEAPPSSIVTAVTIDL